MLLVFSPEGGEHEGKNSGDKKKPAPLGGPAILIGSRGALIELCADRDRAISARRLASAFAVISNCIR